MNISLPDALKSFVDQQVSTRGYATSSEYVRDLIRKDQDIQKLRGLLTEGAASDPTAPADETYFAGLRDSVSLLSIQQMLTTQQAADLLNVSRPYLIKLIEKGDIPHSMAGRHRRLKAEDVLAYKSARDKVRAQALDELIADSADLY